MGGLECQVKDMHMFSALSPHKKMQVEERVGRHFLFSSPLFSEIGRQILPSTIVWKSIETMMGPGRRQDLNLDFLQPGFLP